LVQEAARLHMMLLHPKYREAERVDQAILEEYLEPQGESEVAYRVIVEKTRGLGVRHMVPDVGELAAQVLREKGVKVGR
jgi:hypothetical protein